MNRVGQERNSLAEFFVHPIDGAFAGQSQKAAGGIYPPQKALIIP
jgi:hypothetical protein